MEIDYASATKLADEIRSGRISATEALLAHLARIESINPVLNAVVVLDVERALARARRADEARARGEIWGKLHGVPFTLKDTHATAGVRTTSGYPQLADYVPTEDSTVVTRLKAAGGILAGKTNVAFMLGDYQSNNSIFGRTSNPWDIERTPGGSSGGAAAAVAAGMTPFDIGTDLAGSIRVPAHFCGVFGLKPTEHRVPLTGVVPGFPPPRPIRIMSCIGPIARTVDDLTLLYGIIAGPDGLDTDVPPVPLEAPRPIDLEGLRIAVAPTFPDVPISEEIRATVLDLARRLDDAGANVDQPYLPDMPFAEVSERLGTLIGMLTSVTQPSEHPATLGQYLDMLHQRDESIVAWERFFDDWDVLLCPTSMTTAFPHCDAGTPLQVDGETVNYWMVAAHSAPFSYSGHPAVVVPAGLSSDGLPIGVQLVTRRWEDARLLGIAKAVSRVTGPVQRPATIGSITPTSR